MTPTPRPASWETCSVEGDSVDEAWCTTHDRHPGECWDSRESEIKRLTAELAEVKRDAEEAWNREHGARNAKDDALKERDASLARVKELEYWRNGSWAMKALDKARDERDAALAEVERWKDDYDEEARACEENARETQEARDEAEALRAAVNKALDLLADNPDGPQLDLAYDVLNQALGAIRRANRDARPHQWAEGGFCNTHMTYGCGKARLSPPAPAPKHEFAEGGFCNAHMTYGCECPAESLHDPKAPCPECGRRKKPAPGGREE